MTSIGEQAFGYWYGDKINSFIIRGHEGTEAERYAKANGFTFRSSDEHVEWKLSGTELTISGNGYMNDYSWSNAPWGTNITKVTIQNGVRSIGAYAFYDCDKLTSVTIPGSAESIGAYAFYDCDKLTSVTIPESVESIGNNAFEWCSGLEKVNIAEGVKIIEDGAFSSCWGMESITIPNSVTSIGEKAVGYDYFGPLDGFVICGYEGSEAERYAKANGFTFRNLSGVMLGDADCDTEVTILDATAIQRYLAGLTVSAFSEQAADADGDSEVTILDATAIQRWLAGLPTNKGIGK